MAWWLWLVSGLALVALAACLLALWLRSFKLPAPARRVLALPWRRKLALVSLLLKDGRVPIWAKIVLPALIVYLALPVDLIPDFIPVIGHLDDLLLVALAATLLFRGIPPEVMEEHIGWLERGGEQQRE
jgi:uncharacterized membrane protein YkvA (DUF1232 family)